MKRFNFISSSFVASQLFIVMLKPHMRYLSFYRKNGPVCVCFFVFYGHKSVISFVKDKSKRVEFFFFLFSKEDLESRKREL